MMQQRTWITDAEDLNTWRPRSAFPNGSSTGFRVVERPDDFGVESVHRYQTPLSSELVTTESDRRAFTNWLRPDLSQVVPSESQILALGGFISGLALVFTAKSGEWNPQLFWISLILMISAAARRAKR